MRLDSDTSKFFFVLIFVLFQPYFSFSCTTWRGLTQVSSKLCMCSISTPHKTRMFTVRLVGNGHGFAVAVLALAMPREHPNVTATVLRISLNSSAQKTILIFKNYHWSSDYTTTDLESSDKVSSKFVHAFCLQTPITAKCSMRGC